MESIKLNGVLYNRQNLDKLYRETEPDDSWQNAIYHFLLNWFDDTAFIPAQTSGSTGKPKAISLSKTSMVNSARMTNRFFGLTAGSVCLFSLPATYIAGKMMLVRAMVGGFNLLTVEPSADPFKMLHTSIDFASITPYQLFHSAKSLQEKAVRKIIVGGGPVTKKLEKLSENITSELYETYGMTETCSHIALRRFNGVEKSEYFTILEGVSIHLDDRECLTINAPHLLDTEIQTNDIVELNGTNSFRWLGRADSTINSGGIKIHPEQIEKKLEEIIPSSYFISSVPDELLGNKVILVIESEAFTPMQEDTLKAQLAKVLTRYEAPKQVLYLSCFIRSESNKVLRKPTLQKALE
ncbi:MAG: AMP-binding protein [Bacteroidota bacterium]|nr:AMP-binding protein [Bacteroidota bacterium]